MLYFLSLVEDEADSRATHISSRWKKVLLMTGDEWRVRGIEFALSAEGSEIVPMLQKAERCFALSRDEVLRSQVLLQIGLEETR